MSRATRDVLMMAVLALKHSPAPDERAQIIRVCEAEITRLQTEYDAQNLRLTSARAARAGSLAFQIAARANGMKGGKPKKDTKETK